MIRFVDLTPFYWCDEHASNPPVCAFVDTITDRFVTANGEHVFHDDESIGYIEDERLCQRCRGHVPDGFWERNRSAAGAEMAVASGEEAE